MTDTKSPLTVRLSDDKTTATVRVTMVPLTGKAVEDAIGALATARSQMEPPVPVELPVDYPVHRHQGTHCYVAWDFLTGKPSITFRSPAYGWLKFLIAAEQVPAICEALMAAKAMSEEARHALPQ